MARLAGWRQGLGWSGRGRRKEAAGTRQGRQTGPTRDQTGQADRPHVGGGCRGRGAPAQPRCPRAPQPLAEESQSNPEPRGASVFPSVQWAHPLATAVGQALSPHRGQQAASSLPAEGNPSPGPTPRSSRATLSFPGLMALVPSLLLLGGGPGPSWPSRRSEETQACSPRTREPHGRRAWGPLVEAPNSPAVPTPGQPQGPRLHAWPRSPRAPTGSGPGLWAGPRGRFSPPAPITHTALPGLLRHRWAGLATAAGAHQARELAGREGTEQASCGPAGTGSPERQP